MAHKQSEPYSGKNPVPKIATKITSLWNPEHATDAKAKQLQDQSPQQDEKQTKKTASTLAKGHVMHVTDPTTGEELDIRNAAEEQEPESAPHGQNVLHHGFPPPDWKAHRDHVVAVTCTSMFCISAAYIICFLFSRLFSSSFLSTMICILPPSFLSYCLLFRLTKKSESDFEDRIWHAERMRGLRAGLDVDENGEITDEERTRESAEWANALLRGVWPIVNTDMFSAAVDMLEDIMQSSVPGFVHSVRIADVGLGSNAGRITSIRSLPDTADKKSGSSGEGFEESMGVDPSNLSDEDREALDSDHVNLELSFAYRGLPSGRSASSKAKNIHLLIEFFLGIKGLYGFKIPVWVEITGAVGTMRARLQLISNPPFVKTTLVTLMGLPRITISVIPLRRLLPNVMDLPFVSGFISSAIDTAAAEYVAPRSLTLDLQRLISGDDIKKNTEAIGVLVVHIHRATGVKSMDSNGKSDPYVTLTYSRLGKPLYSTRIIKADCNPVFEETAILMVDTNTVKLREKLSFQLWDSDRLTADDMLGFAEIDIVDFMRRRGKAARQVSTLSSPDSQQRPGSIEYTVGYYGKVPPSSLLSTDGSDPSLPDDLRQKPEFKEARAVSLSDLEAAVLTTPPDPEWPSGILSVQVHEIRDLTVKSLGSERIGGKGLEGVKGQDQGEQIEEEAEGLPSSYCTISLNDELVYKTRVKPITSSPMFNAGTERFVRDWRKAHVNVTVKDSRMRENDAILGVVFLKLADIFVNASEVTRFYSLEQGLGYGRMRISLLFRNVEAKLPPNLLGFDTGTVVVNDIAVKSDDQELTTCEVRLKATTSGVEEKVSRKTAEVHHDGSIVWSSEGETDIPVRERYGTALLVSFRSLLGSGTSAKKKALAVLWLRDLVDHVEGKIEIPLWHTNSGDYSRLQLNYVPPDGNLDFWDSDREQYERIGSVWLDIVFRPGVSDLHHKLLDGAGAKKKGAWDEYDRQESAGLRDNIGRMDESTPQDHQSSESHYTRAADGQATAGSQHKEQSLTDGPLNTPDGDAESAGGGADAHATNTVVSPENAEHVSSGSEGHSSREEHHTDSGHETEDSEGKGGLVGRFKEWKKHERELHRDHRGMMQKKPARTAVWLKDNVEDGARAVKKRFSLRSRSPDIETEV